MKILKIRVKNLNSLKSPNGQAILIDLEQPPLCNAGLYLITGNTGAGKSSILDAVTLALFGKTDRNGGKELYQIVSHGCEEALAEVEFELNDGKRYRAKWQLKIKTSKKSKVNPDKQTARPHRELALLPEGKLLADKTKEVDAEIQKLLQGLNFEQFTRTVMLAQGEFARFLKDDKDRASILERITDTRDYSEISNAAFLRWREAEAQFNQSDKELKAQADRLLTEEELEGLETERKQLEEESLQLGDSRQQLDKELLEAQRWLEWRQKSEELETDKQNHRAEAANFQPNQQKLNQHKDLAACAELFNQFDSQAEIAQTQQQRISQEKARQDSLLLDLERLSQQLETEQQAYEQAHQTHQNQLPIWDKAIEQDSVIKELENQLNNQPLSSKEAALRALEISYQQQQAAHEQLLTEQSKEKADWERWRIYEPLMNAEFYFEWKAKLLNSIQEQKAIKEHNLAISRYKQELEQNDKQQLQVSRLYEEKSLVRQQLREEYNQYCERYGLGRDDYQYNSLEQVKDNLQSCQNFLKALQHLKNLIAENQKLFELINNQNDDFGKTLNEEAIWEKSLLNNQEQRDYWQAALDKTEYVRKKTEYILGLQSHLHQSEHCPVCKADKLHFGDWDKAVKEDYERELLQLDGEKQQLAAQLEQVETEYRKLIEEMQRCKEAKNRLFELLNNYFKQLQSNEETIYLLLQQWQLKMDIKDLTDKRLQELERQFSRQSDDYQKVLNRRGEWLLQYKQLSEAIEQYSGQLDEYKEQATGLKQRLNRQEEEKASLEANLEATKAEFAQQFGAFADILNYLGDWEQLISRLEKLYNSYHERKKRIDQAEQVAKDSLQKLDTAAQALEGEKQRWEEFKAEAQSRLERVQRLKAEREALLETNNPQEARANSERQLNELRNCCQNSSQQLGQTRDKWEFGQEKIADWGKEWEKADNNLHHLELVLSSIANAEGFAQLEQMRAAILSAEEVKMLENWLNGLENTGKMLASRALELEKQRLQFADGVENRDIESLQAAILENHQAQKANLTRSAQVQQSISQHWQQYENVKELSQEVERHKKELARWERLKKLIGSENGQVFSRFAQALTLQRLVQVANRHLSKFIDDRYRLIQNDPQQLNLDIIDQFQSNNQRGLSTLSGGETFLASLALALALADLIGGKMRIYSLFIDEGFGTLDTDTLAMAVAVLQSLQGEGKNIGIISHVEQLQQQISTQIRVTAKGGGVSEVSVVG